MAGGKDVVPLPSSIMGRGRGLQDKEGRCEGKWWGGGKDGEWRGERKEKRGDGCT